MASLDRIRATRDATTVRASLARIGADARAGVNLMPALVEAVAAYATVGEMCDALRQVWGEYEEVPSI